MCHSSLILFSKRHTHSLVDGKGGSAVPNNNLNPFWITGLCESSWHFFIKPFIRNASGYAVWQINYCFEIVLPVAEQSILYRIKDFFGVGLIYIKNRQCIYRINRLTDLLNVIIPHFTNYPLLTRKILILKVWTIALSLVEQKRHLTDSGLIEILEIYAAMVNKKITKTVSLNFPNLMPVSLPSYSLDISELNGWWVSGYLTINCSFWICVLPKWWDNKLFECLRHSFSVSRNIEHIEIISALCDYLQGNLIRRSNEERVDLNINSIHAALNLISFFERYPLESTKHAKFLIFKQFVELASTLHLFPGYRKSKLLGEIQPFLDLEEKFLKIKEKESNQ